MIGSENSHRRNFCNKRKSLSIQSINGFFLPNAMCSLLISALEGISRNFAEVISTLIESNISTLTPI